MKKLLTIIFSLLLTLTLIPISIISKEIEAKEEPNYLTFTANTAGSTITFNYVYASGIKTSTDGETWSDYKEGTTITLNNVNDKVLFKATCTMTGIFDHFSMTGSISASGDVTSLTNGTGGDVDLSAVPSVYHIQEYDACYSYMFYGCGALTTAPNLPSTTLVEACYSNMFDGCSKLTTAPELPALTLDNYCYDEMFQNCSSLKETPDLPATTLFNYCYDCMFNGCTSLEIPADISHVTKLAANCCSSMYAGCTNLLIYADNSHEGYEREWKTPNIASAASWNDKMFDSLTPALNTTYYVKGSNGYLAFTANENNAKITLNKVGSPSWVGFYSTDGKTFNTYDCGKEITLKNKGDKVYFKGYYYGNNSDSKYLKFSMSGSISASGNIMSICDTETGSTSIPFSYMFYKLFEGCTSLTTAPELPATTLKAYSYAYMFSGCTNLKEAPELPAGKNDVGQLGAQCYDNMFSGCTSLTVAPELPAKTLTIVCYNEMFKNCTNLVSAPDLPATTMVATCYKGMFSGCTKLERPADISHVSTIAKYCFKNMYYGCTNLKIYTDDSNKGYTKEWKATTASTAATDWNKDMFTGAGAAVTPTNRVTYYVKDDPSYLTFKASSESSGNDSVTFNYLSGSVQISTDGKTWIDYEEGTKIVLAEAGDKVYFRGTNVITSASEHFTMTGYISADGDVTSLTNSYGGDIALTTSCYAYMFKDCKSLLEAPDLPSTTLAEGCYQSMFYGCENLKNLSELPAETLAKGCYESMFEGCTSLQAPPVLPATTLAPNCYAKMFKGCTSMVATTELNAMTLAESCYASMFEGCTSLILIFDLPAETLAKSCYENMFSGCTGLYYEPIISAKVLAERSCFAMFKGCTNLLSPAFMSSVTDLASACCEEMYANCEHLGIYTDNKTTGYTREWVVPNITTVDGWNTKMFDNVKASVTPEVNKTYYVKDDSLIVTYYGNGATFGAAPVDSVAHDKGSTVTVKDQGTLGKIGYTFKNWNTKADGSGDPYVAGNTFTINADTNLYAQWLKNIEYELDDSIAVEYDGAPHTIKVVVKNIDDPSKYTIYCSTDDFVTSTIADSYTLTDAGSVTNIKFKIVASGYAEVTTEARDITITKRPITFESSSAIKIYDKTPLTNDEVKITEGTLAGSDQFKINVTGSQTAIGVSKNTFTLEGTKIDNYEISKVEGTLTVNPTIIKEGTTPTFNGITGKITYQKGKTKNCTLKIEKPFVQDKTSVTISNNGVDIISKYYTVESGSTLITLKSAYLNTLNVGTYKLKIDVTYNEGSPSDGTFTYYVIVTIKSNDPTPYVPVNTSCK